MPQHDQPIVLNKDEDTVSFIEVESRQTVQKIGVGHNPRSEERRGGKEGRSRWSPVH